MNKTKDLSGGHEIEAMEADGFGQIWAVWIEDKMTAAAEVASRTIGQSVTPKRRLTPEELAGYGMRPGDVLKIKDIIP